MYFTLNGLNELAEDMLKHSENFQIQIFKKPIKVELIRVRPQMFGFPQWYDVPWQFNHDQVVQGKFY